jgi:hypothetical protein
MFLAAVDDGLAELTREDMNDLFLPCKELAFAALLSQISDFQSQHAFVDDEACKCIPRVEEQNLQQDRALCFLQREFSDLRAADSRLAAKSATLGETNKALALFTAEGNCEVTRSACTSNCGVERRVRASASLARSQLSRSVRLCSSQTPWI